MATRKANSRFNVQPQFDPLGRAAKQQAQRGSSKPIIPQWLWLGTLLILIVWMSIKWVIPSTVDSDLEARHKQEQQDKKRQRAADRKAKADAEAKAKKQAESDAADAKEQSFGATLKAKAKALLGDGATKTNQEDPKDKTEFDFTKAPGFAYPAAIPGQQIVRHRTYTLSYSDAAEQPSWVAYILTPADIEGKASRKDDQFKEDGAVKSGSATLKDYRGSGFDRGHLIPAADRKANEADLAETFLLSNVSPQNHSMNAGIWEHAERQVRTWAKHYGKVYVTTGPCLKPMPTQKIGVSGVAVPEYFYKVVLVADGKRSRAIGFFIPNASSKMPLSAFVMSVNEVERRTGIDFYPLLPDDLEDDIESQADITIWP
jgi:endonuclease G